MPPDRLFRIDVTLSAGYAVVDADGEIDIAAVPELRRKIRQAAERSARVVVDLRPVTFMDTFALRELLGLQAQADLTGTWSLHVVPGTGMQRVLDLSGARGRLRWIAPEQLAS